MIKSSYYILLKKKLLDDKKLYEDFKQESLNKHTIKYQWMGTICDGILLAPEPCMV